MPQLHWQQLDEAAVFDLIDYLIGKELNRSSIGKFIQNLRYVAEKSKMADLSEIKINSKLKKAAPSNPKEPLDFMEFKALVECQVRPEIEPYRKMFLFQCTTGLRFSDCNGKEFKSSVYGIKFTQEKTNIQSFAPVTELSRPIFEYFGQKTINGGWLISLPKISNQNIMVT